MGLKHSNVSQAYKPGDAVGGHHDLFMAMGIEAGSLAELAWTMLCLFAPVVW